MSPLMFGCPVNRDRIWIVATKRSKVQWLMDCTIENMLICFGRDLELDASTLLVAEPSKVEKHICSMVGEAGLPNESFAESDWEASFLMFSLRT